MKFNDWVVFAITFVMGILTGMYLFFTVFVPEYVHNEDLSVLVDDKKDSVQISAERYGGCDRTQTCSGFSLTGDRQYRYQPGTIRSVEAAIETGDIPRSLMHYVVSALEKTDLREEAAPVQQTCASWVDGIDVRYSVIIDSREYILDTCISKFDSTSELGQALNELFVYMNAPEDYTYPDRVRSGLGGLIEETLQDSFQTNNE